MRKCIAAVAVVMFLAAQTARADASYQTSYQITGGSLVNAVKNMAFISKEAGQLTAPMNTLVLVHGNQKATVTKDSIDIIDLDAGTMIHIDKVKKTYSVVTFDELRKMMEKLPELQQQQETQLRQMQQQAPQINLQMSFDVQVKDTGVTKEINGLMATEHIMTLTMKITPPSTAANGTQGSGSTTGTTGAGPTADSPQNVTAVAYTITTDIWIAPDPPQLKEIHDFDLRMAQKMMQGTDTSALLASWKANASGGAATGMLFANQPGAADAMKRLGEELAKLKGTHVLEVTTMGGYGMGPAPAASGGTAQSSAPSPNSNNQGQSVTGQVAQGTAEGTAQGESGRFGVVGSSLTNSVIGAFHRKKKQQQPPPAQQPAPPATASTTQTTQATVLMETTTQESNFSSEPVPTSVFQVPAGYKRVPSPMEKMTQ